MSVERITILLEQLQDTINEQNRLVLLELEPSAEESQSLLELARSCRDSAQALGSPSLSAEYTRLLRQLRELPINGDDLDLVPDEPPAERSRDGKRVRFSDVQQEFDPEPVPEPESDQRPYQDDPIELRTQYDHNQTLMMEQDLRLDGLGNSVRRTHQMSTDINSELDDQMHMIGDLEAQTDSSQDRLSGATSRVQTFNIRARGGGSCMVITILTLILFILLVLL